MKKFNHILLTRFNIRNLQTKGKGLDPEWLDERFKLFEQFCYPSVYSQCNQNFKWLVLFDANTPDFYKSKIQDYSHWQNFIPLYLDFIVPFNSFPEKLRDYIKDHVENDCDYLITSRLDNDDAICKDYVQMIQDNFNEQECEGINFLWGYELHKDKLYLDLRRGNHYISLVEKYDLDSFKTVFCRGHKKLSRVTFVKNIVAKPSWLEIDHGNNIANSKKSGYGLRMPIEKIFNDFSVNKEGAINLKDIILKEKNIFLYLIEQISFLIYFPYYFIKRMFRRIKFHGLN